MPSVAPVSAGRKPSATACHHADSAASHTSPFSLFITCSDSAYTAYANISHHNHFPLAPNQHAETCNVTGAAGHSQHSTVITTSMVFVLVSSGASIFLAGH